MPKKGECMNLLSKRFGRWTLVSKSEPRIDKNFKKKDDKANFINCVAFGKIAETVEQHVFKGSKIAVIGEWTTGSYKNKDGNTVYTNDCNISKLEFCDSKNSSGSSAEPQPKPDDSFMSIPSGIDEELPFN